MTERKRMRDSSNKRNKEDLIEQYEKIDKSTMKNKKKTSKIIEVDVNDKNAFKIRNSKWSIKKYAYLFIFIILGVITLSSSSYAIFTAFIDSDKSYSFSIGTLDFEIYNEENSIRLNNAYPMTDEEGRKLDAYKFKVKNTGTLDSDFKINLIDDEEKKSECVNCNFLEYNKIKVELMENNKVVLGPVLLSDIESLITGTIASGETKEYELRLWLDYQNTTIEDTDKVYYSKINVELTQQIIQELNGLSINNTKPIEIKQIKIYGNTKDNKNLGNSGVIDFVVTGKNLFDGKNILGLKSNEEYTVSINNINENEINIKPNNEIFDLNVLAKEKTNYTFKSSINHINDTYFDDNITFENIEMQVEYGNKPTEYEKYKEMRYKIELIDEYNELIEGLESGDVLEKNNGVYGITKNDGIFIELSENTQKQLNNIMLYDDISNIFIDDEIQPSNITIMYSFK